MPRVSIYFTRQDYLTTYTLFLGLRASCKCDLTGGACDYACCCDKDCPAATISAWQDNGACKANQGGVDGCKAEIGAASLADINALSSVFGDAG